MEAFKFVLFSLAALTSFACMALLFRGYARTGARLLLWGDALSVDSTLFATRWSDMQSDYLLDNDQSFETIITTDGGTTLELAFVYVDATSGDVTITWPVTPRMPFAATCCAIWRSVSRGSPGSGWPPYEWSWSMKA